MTCSRSQSDNGQPDAQQAHVISDTCSVTARQEDDDINIETLSAQIASAVKMHHVPSSLSMGRASILPSVSQSHSTVTTRSRSVSNPLTKRRLSNRFFPPNSFVSWTNRPRSQSQSQSVTLTRTGSPRASESSRHFPSARFSWLVGEIPEDRADTDSGKRSSSASTTASASGSASSSVPDDSSMVDDGLGELLYRGIRVKEIKTTLKTMIIPHEVHHPMPQVKLERPKFARINY